MNEATKSTNIEKMEEMQKKRERILQMGDPRAIEERHKKGQMSARERIDFFLDPGTFTEMGLWVRPRATMFGMDKREVPAEAIVTGFGKVNGRYVTIASADYTAMGGSGGEYHALKYIRIIDFAREQGWPLVNMIDSGGLRFQEGMDAMQAYGALFRALGLASGVVPQIAVLLGPCLGGQGYMPVMQDFLIQAKGTGFLAIAGPAVIKDSVFEEIGLEELAGWKPQSMKAGNIHIVAENEKDALDKAKELLSFFPSNNKEKPPRASTNDDPERKSPELDTLLPERLDKPWDMYELLEKVVDDGHFVEIMKYFASNVIIGFARFNGRPVGIVASQPMVRGGALDVDSSDKSARFIRFCDLFNIPLVSFLDCPAMAIGSEQEWRGILRHGTKLLFAWSNATVPLIAIMVRKQNGGGYHCMLHRGMGADFAFAWPTATFFGTGSGPAASIIYAKEIRESKNPEELRAKRMSDFEAYWGNPYRAGERGYVDDIIMPHDTRAMINRALDALANKTVNRTWKKYDNITL